MSSQTPLTTISTTFDKTSHTLVRTHEPRRSGASRRLDMKTLKSYNPAMRSGVLVVVCSLLAFVCLSSTTSAQTNWARTHGGTRGDEGYSVQQTSDGGFVIAGTTNSFGAGGNDIYLIKTNAEGDTLWTRTYGASHDDCGRSVQQTTDGGYVVTGWIRSLGSEDIYLIKTDAQGDTLWTRTYGGPYTDEGTSIRQTTDGGYVVAGLTYSFGPGAGNYSSVYLIRTNPSGDTLWTRVYGLDSVWEMGNSVRRTTDGGYVIAVLGGSALGLIKTNAQGDTLWTREYGVMVSSVEQTTDGGYVMTGTSGRVSLVKTNPSGDTLWTRTYGDGSSGGGSVQQTTDGGYVITGSTTSFGAGGEDVYLIKTDATGDTLWTRTCGGNGDDIGRSVQQTADGDYVIAGYTTSFGAGGSDAYLVKTNGYLDVGSVAILSPPGIAESGRAYLPSVVVRNYGHSSTAFQATMDIGTGYARTVQESLGSGAADTVVFPPWTAEPVGPVNITCFTSLLGDEDPTNDTIADTVQVLPPPWHDVGARGLSAPVTVRVGDTVILVARIRNFGNRTERFFDVRFRIGTSYTRTVNVVGALLPDSAVEVTFPPWVAEVGDWAMSCSTMLAGDEDSSNDKVSASIHVSAQVLRIEPDQSHGLQAGLKETYQFYALVQSDTGAVVEVARPSPPPGWSVRLGNATGADDLTDTDGDGTPDLGYLAPGESGWFSLDVTAPPETQGDTATLGQVTFLVAGHIGDRPDITDTAVLTVTLVPELSIHNFPNPFSTSTAFVIGLPADGKASLTVYTRAGQRVCRVLENTDLPAGVHVVPWEGTNDDGCSAAPGTYEYLLDYIHSDKTDRIRKRLVLTRQ